MLKIIRFREIQTDFFISVLLTALVVFFSFSPEKVTAICSKYDVYVSLSATFLGFLITAYAILITFPGSYKIKIVKSHRDYPFLFDAFILGILVMIILFVISFIGYLFGISSDIFCIIVTFFLVYSFVFVLRIVWILKKMTDIYHSTTGE